MPLNRVNQVKAISFWLMVLNANNASKEEEEEREREAQAEGQQQKLPRASPSASLSPSLSQTPSLSLLSPSLSHPQPSFAKKMSVLLFGTHQRITKYEVNAKWWVPGMLIVTMPEAGLFLGYVDVGYWAGFLYVLGSVFYVLDSFFIWPAVYAGYSDDAFSAGVFLNLLGAWGFVVNALVCFLDWHTQVKQLSVMNMDINENITGGFEISEINYKITWYYFFNNFFFLGAAVIYLIQGLWMESLTLDLEHCSAGFCGSFWINFWGSFLYLLSSVFAVAEYFEDKNMRKRMNAPKLLLFTTNWKLFDWFGWGDWLYLLTSIMSWAQTFLMFSPTITDDDTNAYYLVVNLLFLLDSLAYFIGYLDFVMSLRTALLTGSVPESPAAVIQEMIGDTAVSETEMTERHSLLPTDANGNVKIDDIKLLLKEARNVRLRRTEASLLLHKLKQPDTENPILRATISQSSNIELRDVKKDKTRPGSKKFHEV